MAARPRRRRSGRPRSRTWRRGRSWSSAAARSAGCARCTLRRKRRLQRAGLAEHLADARREREVALEVEAPGEESRAGIELARGDAQEVGERHADRELRLARGTWTGPCDLVAHGDGPGANVAASGAQLVLQLAGKALGLRGVELLDHAAEDHAQARPAAGDLLETAVVEAPRPALEGGFAGLHHALAQLVGGAGLPVARRGAGGAGAHLRGRRA